MESLGERLLVDSESETTSARSLKLQSRLRLLTHLLVLAATLLVAGIVLDRHVQWVSTAAHLVPLASMGIMCRPDLSPSQYCPDGKPCPASGSCPSEPSLPSWTMQPPPIGSPARVWSSDAQERAQAGCGMIQEIAMKGVIDQFMLLQPGTREILWNRSLDHESTIERMELHAKSLSLEMDVDTWMAKEGYVFTHATTKRRHWRRGAQTLSSKTTPDFTERLGPNNGFMRVFFHDVATKLRAFHPGYGWDEGLVAALYRAGGQEMTLVHRAYEKNWTEEESPRGWVLAMIATNDLCVHPRLPCRCSHKCITSAST